MMICVSGDIVAKSCLILHKCSGKTCHQAPLRMILAEFGCNLISSIQPNQKLQLEHLQLAQCILRTGSSKFLILRALIFHANFLESNVLIPVTHVLNEIIIHSLQFNVVNLISALHMMDQQPPKTMPSKIHFANSNIFPNG